MILTYEDYKRVVDDLKRAETMTEAELKNEFDFDSYEELAEEVRPDIEDYEKRHSGFFCIGVDRDSEDDDYEDVLRTANEALAALGGTWHW